MAKAPEGVRIAGAFQSKNNRTDAAGYQGVRDRKWHDTTARDNPDG
jgi:hypothetical protein